VAEHRRSTEVITGSSERQNDADQLTREDILEFKRCLGIVLRTGQGLKAGSIVCTQNPRQNIRLFDIPSTYRVQHFSLPLEGSPLFRIRIFETTGLEHDVLLAQKKLYDREAS
jgi:hypothetical protein